MSKSTSTTPTSTIIDLVVTTALVRVIFEEAESRPSGGRIYSIDGLIEYISHIKKCYNFYMSGISNKVQEFLDCIRRIGDAGRKFVEKNTKEVLDFALEAEELEEYARDGDLSFFEAMRNLLDKTDIKEPAYYKWSNGDQIDRETRGCIISTQYFISELIRYKRINDRMDSILKVLLKSGRKIMYVRIDSGCSTATAFYAA